MSPRRLAPAVAVLAGVAVLAAGCGGGPSPTEDAARRSAEAAAALKARQDALQQVRTQRGAPLLRGAAERIDGERQDLAAYRGRVVMIVNTASRCGYTPQFEGLQALYRERRDQGLTILGFPSDDFQQELADNRSIKRFCTLNYGVDFPMFARSHVTGAKATPLFRRLAAASAPPEWNFTKYLVDREGRLSAVFPSSTPPDDPAVTAAVERLLAEGAPPA